MKFARFIACLLGIVTAAVMIFSIGFCLISLDAEVKVLEMPTGAVECSDSLQEAIRTGDFTAASEVIYGQPDFGADRVPADTAGIMIWDAFRSSISFEYTGDCYATDSGIARDAVVTVMEIPSVTEQLRQRAHALLTARVEAATDMAELYDENNNFREDLVEDVLNQALTQALAEDAETVRVEGKVNLICRDGKWWAVPEEALLTALSGGVA